MQRTLLDGIFSIQAFSTVIQVSFDYGSNYYMGYELFRDGSDRTYSCSGIVENRYGCRRSVPSGGCI